MLIEPYLPNPPYPQNEHEAKVVGLLFFITWGLGLLFLYWQASRPIKDEEEKQVPELKNGSGKP